MTTYCFAFTMSMCMGHSQDKLRKLLHTVVRNSNRYPHPQDTDKKEYFMSGLPRDKNHFTNGQTYF